MSEKHEGILKQAAKHWAKHQFLLLPWNLLSFGCTLALLKRLCSHVGPTGYGTTAGNFKISGIMFLAALVSALFINFGSVLFRVKGETGGKEQRDAFWLAGIWIPLSLAGIVIFFGRALLILVGIMNPGAAPPPYLVWLFDEHSIDFLLHLGVH